MRLPLNRRRITRVVWGLVVLMAVAAGVDAALLWRDQRRNAALAGATALPDEPVPEIQFGQAYALAVSGDSETALNRYRALQADSVIGRAARFNAANLLLRQAIAVRASAQPGQSIALFELAKESLRELLRQDPQQWDARYNLERAQRLLPDPEGADDAAVAGSRERERAVTTMRSQSLGLP